MNKTCSCLTAASVTKHGHQSQHDPFHSQLGQSVEDLGTLLFVLTELQVPYWENVDDIQFLVLLLEVGGGGTSIECQEHSTRTMHLNYSFPVGAVVLILSMHCVL